MAFLFGLRVEVIQAFLSDVQGDDSLCIIGNSLCKLAQPC